MITMNGVIPWLNLNFLVEILAFSIGFLWGESFSKFDQYVKYGNGNGWFSKLSRRKQWLVERILDANHHFQYGLVLMILAYFVTEPLLALFTYAMGFGLLVSDLKDYKYVLKRFFSGITEVAEREEH